MGNSAGISVMGKNTDLEANQVGTEQALANQLLLRALQQPVRPEVSPWQGAARMAEMLVSAHKQTQAQQKQDAYNAKRQASMGALATALSGGNPGAIAAAISGMNDPQSQMMGLQAMIAQNQQNQLFGQQRSMKGLEHQYGIEDKGIDYNHKTGEMGYGSTLKQGEALQGGQISAGLEGVKGSVQRQNESSKLQGETQKDLLEKQQIGVQQRMVALAKVINDPNAPQPLKDLAAKDLQTQQQLNAEMHTGIYPSSPDAGMVNGTGIAGNAMIGGRSGGSSAGGGSKSGSGGGGSSGGGAAAPDIQQQGVSAKDLLANMNQVAQDIQTGVLNNQNMTQAGRAIEYAKEANGLPNSMAAISRYEQLVNQKTLAGTKEFQSMGGTSTRITKPILAVIEGAQLNKNDLPESIQPKLFMQMEGAQRLIQLADLQQQWIDKNGGIDRRDNTSGMSWEQLGNKFNNANPIVSYNDFQKNNQNKLDSQLQNGNQPQNPQVQPLNQNQPQQNQDSMGGKLTDQSLAATGKPIIQNPDGSISTERTIGVQDSRLNGGRETNIPTIWNGKELPMQDAINAAVNSGQQFNGYDNVDSANKAAQDRSAQLGQSYQQQQQQQPQQGQQQDQNPYSMSQMQQQPQPQNMALPPLPDVNMQQPNQNDIMAAMLAQKQTQAQNQNQYGQFPGYSDQFSGNMNQSF
jgi:hypothetical protein